MSVTTHDFWDFDGQWSWDEYQEQLTKTTNVPVVGPWVGYYTGDYLPTFSEESIGATVSMTGFLYALGATARLAAATFVAARNYTPHMAAAAITLDVIANPEDNVITRAYEASVLSLFFGDHLFQQHGIRGGLEQGYENLLKNFRVIS